MATMKSLRNSSVTFHNDVVHGSRVYHSYSLKTTSGLVLKIFQKRDGSDFSIKREGLVKLGVVLKRGYHLCSHQIIFYNVIFLYG